jgi:hypothetical protein
VTTNLGRPMVLVDGFAHGTWKIVQEKSSVLLTIEPFGRFTQLERDTLVEEGTRLLHFAAPEATSRSAQFSAH